MSTSKCIKHATGGVTLVALFTLVLLVRSGEANLMWHWTGDCVTNRGAPTLCHHATAEFVTLDSYVPGTVFVYDGFPTQSVNPTLLVARYSDDAGGTDGVPDFGWPNAGIFFEFPAASGPGMGAVRTEVVDFRSGADGVWHFGAERGAPDCTMSPQDCSYRADGINGTWTIQTPEPGTWLLVHTALGLAWLARKKRTATSIMHCRPMA